MTNKLRFVKSLATSADSGRRRCNGASVDPSLTTIVICGKRLALPIIITGRELKRSVGAQRLRIRIGTVSRTVEDFEEINLGVLRNHATIEEF